MYMEKTVEEKLKEAYNKLEESSGFNFLFNNTELLTMSGSIVYGANLDKSDYDFKGVVFGSKEALYGLHPFEQANTMGRKSVKTKAGEVDLGLYGLQKYLGRYAMGDFNALQLVSCNKEFVVKSTEFGEKLVQELPKFNSKFAVASFKGNTNQCVKQVKRFYEEEPKLAYKAMYQAFNYLLLGQEYMTKGKFVTYKKERAERLLEVRKGLFTSVEEFEKELHCEEEKLEALKLKSFLPEKVNTKELSLFATKLYTEYHNL